MMLAASEPYHCIPEGTPPVASETSEAEDGSSHPDSSVSDSQRPPYRSRRSRKKRLSERITNMEPSDSAYPEMLLPEEVPLERFRFPDEGALETDDGVIPTMQIWATNVADMKYIGALLEHIRRNGEAYEAESLKHLKRVRKVLDAMTGETSLEVAIAPSRSQLPSFPPFPNDLVPHHSEPYVVTVPSTPATSPLQLMRKSPLWPVGYFPVLDLTKKEKEWTKDEVNWVQDGLRKAVGEAERARHGLGELPIAAYVTPCYDTTPPLSTQNAWSDHDSRRSTHHPLRHVCLNVIRKVAAAQSTLVLPSSTPSSIGDVPLTLTPAYLLTSYALFITHEPCIMCSMALLHSRVKMIFYLIPMPRTGGCGGSVKQSVPGLDGVNHRFGIWKWTGLLSDVDASTNALQIQEDLDV